MGRGFRAGPMKNDADAGYGAKRGNLNEICRSSITVAVDYLPEPGKSRQRVKHVGRW
jgi:hypothetical protein